LLENSAVTKRLMPLAAAAFALMVAGDCAWGQAPDATDTQPQFTIASLSGVCGFTMAATNVVPTGGSFLQPRAAVGTLDFNGAGHVSLTGTQNKHGVVAAFGPFSGKYSVDADGRTGTIDLNLAGGPTLQFEIVSGGAELRFMNTGPVDPTLGIVKETLIGVCKF
jgi:hypothetical protein